MSKHDKPAYPFVAGPQDQYAEPFIDEGLTRRELFAAMAMQGILASGASPGTAMFPKPPPELALDQWLGIMSEFYGDALCAVLDGEPPPALDAEEDA